MKEYVFPFNQRVLILSVLGLPFLFQNTTAIGLFLPLAAWMVWGDWRVIQVNQNKIRFRSSFWFGKWREVAWMDVKQADWVAFDTASLSLNDDERVTVSFGGLNDRDRSEVAGWLNEHCRTGLRRVADPSEAPRA